MNILSISPSASAKYIFVDYHHGIGIFSALPKRMGHATFLLLMTHFNSKRLDREIAKIKPDIIAYSFTSDHAPMARIIMQYLANRHIFPIAGGVHPTVDPVDIVLLVDCLCRGEGEGVFWIC